MNVQLSSTGAAYIRYTTSPSVDNLYVGEGETAGVIVDVDEGDKIVGIEILDVSVSDDLARARDFATEHGLPFPRNLAAAARDASAA